MFAERIRLSLDITSDSIAAANLVTPRPTDSVFRITGIKYDIALSSGSTLPNNLYVGLSPSDVDTSVITAVTQTLLSTTFPEATAVEQIITESSDDGTQLLSTMTKTGFMSVPEDMYSLKPTLFIGTGAGSVGAGMPDLSVYAVVEYEYAKLTNQVASIIATRCAGS